jgi:signal transduction histidine kinase
MKNTEVDRIFDRFYRADIARTRTVDGTGLGLSIVKTIVDLHGGQITVKSIENEGTDFILKLPIK